METNAPKTAMELLTETAHAVNWEIILWGTVVSFICAAIAAAATVRYFKRMSNRQFRNFRGS